MPREAKEGPTGASGAALDPAAAQPQGGTTAGPDFSRDWKSGFYMKSPDFLILADIF